MRTFLAQVQIVLCLLTVIEHSKAIAADADYREEAVLKFKRPEKPLNFRAFDLSGRTVGIDFEKYNGQAVVLYFWNVDRNVDQDRDDIRDLMKMARKYPEVKVLAVHLYSKKVNDGLVQVVKKIFADGAPPNVRFLLVDDSLYAGSGYLLSYEAYTLPFAVFVEPSGRISAQRNGHLLWNSYYTHRLIEEMLSAK